MPAGPDVVGSAEARALLGGIGRVRFKALVDRADFPDFTELEIGRVYDRAEVTAWMLTRPRGPKPLYRGKPLLRALRLYRSGMTVRQVAAEIEVHPTTIDRWLAVLGAR